jgi:hypothetical protein
MKPPLEDPIWTYLLMDRLKPYLPYARKWWENIDNYKVVKTGLTEVIEEGAPNGLYIRVTRSPVQSPIRNIQSFPLVISACLQLAGTPGGSNKMVEYICQGGLQMGEMTIIEKHGLQSIRSGAQFLAFVPTEVLNKHSDTGAWVHMTRSEADAMLALGDLIPDTFKAKLQLKAI